MFELHSFYKNTRFSFPRNVRTMPVSAAKKIKNKFLILKQIINFTQIQNDEIVSDFSSIWKIATIQFIIECCCAGNGESVRLSFKLKKKTRFFALVIYDAANAAQNA